MVGLVKTIKSGTILGEWNSVIKSGAAGILGKGVTAATRLISIPLALNYLGREQYGVWILISSIAGYILLFDFGISSAIVNEVTKYNAEGDKKTASEFILSAFIAISFIALFLILLAVPIIYSLNWKELFKISESISASNVANIFLLGTILFLLQLPISIFLKIPYTFQRGYEAEVFLMAANLLSFAGIIVSVHWDLGMYPLVAFLIAPQLLAGLGLAIYLRAKGDLEFVRMSYKEIVHVVKKLRSTAADFVVMQIVSALIVVLQFNMLGYYKGAKEVAVYGYLTQIATAIQMPLIILLQPMWTKFVQLIKLQKLDEVKAMTKRYHMITGAYSIFISFFFVVALNPITALITKEPMLVGLDLRLLFALNCCLGLAFGGFLSMITASLNLTRTMMFVNIGQVTLFLVSSYLLVPKFSIVGTVIACLTSFTLAIPFYYFRVRNKLSI
jgi:O-antigen/teichoic acid export membrane protein